MRMAALLGANALMLVAGLGMLPPRHRAPWRLLVFRCGSSPPVHLVLVGIVPLIWRSCR
jgi:hypothetical protein